MAATARTTGGTCDNCGGPGDGLEEVRRQYVTLDDQGRVTGSETLEEPERWCPACRSMYPHTPGASGPEPPRGVRES